MKSALKSSNGPRISQASKRVTLTSPTSSPDKSRRMTNDELTDIPTAGGGGYSKKFESKKAPQKTEPPIMEAEKDKLVKRFMDKISEQVRGRCRLLRLHFKHQVIDKYLSLHRIG